jgi:predicted nucleotide-binding protein (sugar kinase/HSP70/actin superfamily)
VKVGLPRALLFHHYGEGWTSFLDAIGVEPVVSASTTGEVVVSGAVHADNETCLPVKVFTGHLLELKEQTDALLVPRVISQHRGTKACPKYLGLPDMARSMGDGLPPVLSPVMDLADRRGRWTEEWRRLARDLGATGKAAAAAVGRMLDCLRALELPDASRQGAGFPVGVAGHLYNVYDERVSLGLLDRIRGMGAEPVTVEQVPRRDVRRQLKTLDRKIRWDFENRIVGAVLHWSRTASVAGVVYVNSFACGPGSMIGALIEDEFARHPSVPLMSITLDEHSAEAGLMTRVEAFLDMLKRAGAAEGAAHAAPYRGGGA